MQSLLLFHCKNSCMSAPNCYVICTLPVLLIVFRSLSLTSPVKNRERTCDWLLSLCLSFQKAALRTIIPVTTLGGCICHTIAVIFSHPFPAWHYHEQHPHASPRTRNIINTELSRWNQICPPSVTTVFLFYYFSYWQLVSASIGHRQATIYKNLKMLVHIYIYIYICIYAPAF